MQSITDMALAFGAGLIVGWNVLPQPEWARRLYESASSAVKRAKEYFGL